MKKVSIIIPCYNAEKYIKESILSALQQTYENKEVIFVDNESKDNSLNIAKAIKKDYPELIIETAKNIYPYSWQEPVEKALEIFTGDYFTILGADDIIEKEYISNNMAILNKTPEKILCMQSPIMGFADNDINQKRGIISYEYKSLKEMKEQLFIKCPVNTPTVFYNKKLQERGLIRWDSEKYLGAADYNLYFALADNNIFIYPVPKWLGYNYRWHEKQATWGMHKEETDYGKKIVDFWREKWKKN